MNFMHGILAVASSLFLTACSFQPIVIPPENHYTLSAINTVQYRKVPINKTILIAMPTAAPAFQSEAMQYTLHRYQIQSFSYNQWIAPPAEMLLPLLIQSIAHSHYFKAVVSAPYTGISDYRLTTQILDFRQIFYGHDSQFSFVLQATLVNEMTHQVVFSRSFQQTVKAVTTPEGGVIAANQAVQEILNKLIKQLILTSQHN